MFASHTFINLTADSKSEILVEKNLINYISFGKISKIKLTFLLEADKKI